jgi:hypothetical protein
MEHTVDADGEVEAAAEPPAPSGPIGRLLDLLPISRRTRGILMLNVLVLLVATNWVSWAEEPWRENGGMRW